MEDGGRTVTDPVARAIGELRIERRALPRVGKISVTVSSIEETALGP